VGNYADRKAPERALAEGGGGLDQGASLKRANSGLHVVRCT